jgi:hypothetical protein
VNGGEELVSLPGGCILGKEIPVTFEYEIDLIAVWGKEISVALPGINPRRSVCPGRKLITTLLRYSFSTLFVWNPVCVILTSKSWSSSVNLYPANVENRVSS